MGFKCNIGLIKDDNYKNHNNGAWHKKSLEIREASDWLCSVCRSEGRYEYNGLEVHHITKLRDDKSKALDNYNLICLCVKHHKMADVGEIDADYLRKLARDREDNPPTHGVTP